MQFDLPSLNGAARLSIGPRPDAFKEGDFLEATLHVLGVLSNYHPRVFIPGWLPDKTTKRAPLRDRVLRTMRIDPDDPATFPTTSRGRPYGSLFGATELYAVLEWGPGYCHGTVTDGKYGGVPLVIRGNLPPGQTVSGQGPKGSWALTEAGVALAASIHDHYMLRPDMPENGPHTKRNVTCCWLDSEIKTNRLYARLCNDLAQSQRIRKEAETGEIVDHVNHWLSLVIRRDGLKSRLETYDPPPFRQIKDWVYRALWTTLRGRAQDAETRSTYGALTEQERTTGSPAVAAMLPSPFVQVAQMSDDEGGEISYDIVDREALAQAQTVSDFNIGMGIVDKAFASQRENHPRLAKIYEKMVMGYRVDEIAETEGVSRNRMASLLAATRGVLRDAQKVSGDMYTVLEYLQANPWSTEEDLKKDLVDDPKSAKPKHFRDNGDLGTTLGLLAERGRVTTQTFKKGVVGYNVVDDRILAGFLASREKSGLGSMLLL